MELFAQPGLGRAAAKLLLALLRGGHVTGAAEEMIPLGRGIPRQPAVGSVGMAVAVLELEDRLSALDRLEGRDGPVDVIGMQEIEELTALDLLRPVAEDVEPRGIGLHEFPVRIEQAQKVGRHLPKEVVHLHSGNLRCGRPVKYVGQVNGVEIAPQVLKPA